MSQELKPCPFCGGEAKMYYPFHTLGKPSQSATYRGGVRCSCGAESSATTPPDGAIAAWNQRTAIPPEPVSVPDKEKVSDEFESWLKKNAWITGSAHHCARAAWFACFELFGNAEQVPVSVPKGWRLVPIEPTPEMIKRSYWSGSRDTPVSDDWVRVEVYKRMLHIAPQPKQSTQHSEGCGACGDGCQGRGSCRLDDDSPKMVQPAQALTDDEIMEIVGPLTWYDGDCERFDPIQFGRAIETRLKGGE